MDRIRISVRGLVEFILRSGDIDNRRSSGRENAMLEGGRIHRMLQRKMGSEYRAEVSLSFSMVTEHYELIIDGRADGIYEENGVTVIDEIKGTYRDVNRMREPVPVHLAQARCYAYMVMCNENPDSISVRMTYCNMDTEEVRYFYQDENGEELEAWFLDLVAQYRKWADFSYEWNRKRQQSIRELVFPFSYREGQKELVTYVYRTICHQRKLFLEAPTGVGKTISTVFPAVKAMGEEKAQKIFYLTAKTITRTVAEQAFSLLRENGLIFKTVNITAKEKACFQEEVICNPVACPYAKGHMDRINDAMYDLLTHEDAFTRELIAEYALKHQVCPFEMCLDMSLFSDAVICDYNYLFDPHVYLKRFFAEGSKGDYLFLVDEAHNLVDRGRDMYSAQLVKEDFLALKRELKEVREISPSLIRGLEACNKELLALKRECDDYFLPGSIEPFVMALTRLHGRISNYLEDHTEGEKHEEILDFYFEISHFLEMYDLAVQGYVTYCQHCEDGSFLIKLFCVDPSNNLRLCMERGISTILFSATLLPIQYYKNLLGGQERDYEVYAHSVFDPGQKCLLVAEDVTSRYKRRGKEEYRKIAGMIRAVCEAKKGNYMVFFPSHQFMDEVYGYFLEEPIDLLGYECIVQQDRMDEEEREQFLGRFQEGCAVIGFCVLGGIFSEGIDLQRDSLIGAIIVGTGIPQVCLERELLKNYFSGYGKDGFDYAYRFPGMNKVLQAGGRVIRTTEDRGVIALLDDRFLQIDYQRLFPREWDGYERVNKTSIASAVEKFWKSLKKESEE